MSLDYKPKGNPNWKKGISGNPAGKPRGLQQKKRSLKVGERLTYKHKKNPVDELVWIANQAVNSGKLDLAKEIWTDLLQFMEPKKRAQEVAPEVIATPELSKESVENTLKMLEELGNDTGRKESSGTSSLDSREINVQAETSPKEDVSGATE